MLDQDPDRRAWHRAASIIEPHDEVAAESQAAAARARRQGAISVAILAQERAAQLTNEPALRSMRLLQAVESAFESGQPAVALRLMSQSAQLPMSPRDRGALLWLQAMLVPSDTGNATRLIALLDAADVARREGDTDLGRRLLSAAAFGCHWADPGEEVRQAVVGALEALNLPDIDSWLLHALAYAAPITRGAAVLERLARTAPSYADDPANTLDRGEAAAILGAFELSAKFLTVAIEKLRHEGKVALLTRALHNQAWNETYLGNWQVALPAAEEARGLAEESAPQGSLARCVK